MDKEYIKQLVELFFEGKTSTTQEKELFEYFSGKDVSEEFIHLKKFFEFYSNDFIGQVRESQNPQDANLMENHLSDISDCNDSGVLENPKQRKFEAKEQRRRTLNRRIVITVISMSAVAVLAIFVGILPMFHTQNVTVDKQQFQSFVRIGGVVYYDKNLVDQQIRESLDIIAQKRRENQEFYEEIQRIRDEFRSEKK